MAAAAGPKLKSFTGKAEGPRRSAHRTGLRAVWRGLIVIVASVALLGVSAVQASTRYDVQFGDGTPQTGAAVVGASGDYWNFLTSASGSTSLLDAGGGSNGVSLTWSATGIYHFASTFGGGNAALMGGYLYASSAQGVSFSGLPASQPYTLYIYSQSDVSGRELAVTVGGTTYTTPPSAFPTYFIAGQNYLAIPGVTDGSGNLSLTYDVAVGEANLNGMQLSMGRGALAISTQPTNQAVAVGGAVFLSVTAAGAGPLSYQWFKNGGMVLGATNSDLSVVSAGVTDSGVYCVVVTNAGGLVISQPVTVAVGTPQLLVWGANDYGQLGDGTTNSRSTPESVASNVVIAAVGAWHSLYLQGNGILRAMGRNNYGQLGDGTTTSRSNAVSVASNVVAMAAGRYHSLYLKGDGTLWGGG